jgi:hypothetical protein
VMRGLGERRKGAPQTRYGTHYGLDAGEVR